MYQYLVRRLLQAVPLLLFVSVLLFVVLQLQPIHAWDQLLYRPNLTAADRARILAYYGFDKPAPVQYLIWLRNIIHLDLGTSYFSHQPTLELIAQRLPNTAILMLTAYSLALALAIPIGVISAVKQYSKFDNFVTAGAFFGFSIPNFCLGRMLIILLAVVPYEHLGFKIFPTSGMYDSGQEGDPFNLAWHLVLPAIVLAVQPLHPERHAGRAQQRLREDGSCQGPVGEAGRHPPRVPQRAAAADLPYGHRHPEALRRRADHGAGLRLARHGAPFLE